MAHIGSLLCLKNVAALSEKRSCRGRICSSQFTPSSGIAQVHTKRPGERVGAPGKAMKKRWRMLKVQPMKQEDFCGALLWAVAITDTNKYKLLALFASLWVVHFTVLLVAGHFWFKFSIEDIYGTPTSHTFFGKQNNSRRAPDCLVRPMAHPEWIILQRIQSLSFCESLKYQKILMAFQTLLLNQRKQSGALDLSIYKPQPRSCQKVLSFWHAIFEPKNFVFSGLRLTVYCQNDMIQVTQVDKIFRK